MPNTSDRPDLAPAPQIPKGVRKDQPKIGLISLGCPKALVDSERILSRLRAEGYDIVNDYQGAGAVIVNTCGFLDSAKAESMSAIGEALEENGRVIVTGCFGVEEERIKAQYPKILAITGPHQYEAVLDAVHQAIPPRPDPFIDLLPQSDVQLTPRHYAYLKISEGCNHQCKFCIIPDLRGKLQSRPVHAVLKEAEKLAERGVKELLVISQDSSAYGLDRKYDEHEWNGQIYRSHIQDLAEGLGRLGLWTRLHYIYPYPHIRNLIPLMAEGKILPYLDVPLQHAHPDTLKRMARPAQGKTLNEIHSWREICPDLTLRSTFIVGYPGETEAEFSYLLDWLEEAQLDRVGAFQYENVQGARANALENHIDEEIKAERYQRFMEKAQAISQAKLSKKLGQILDVIIDNVDEEGAIGRSQGDAPEIDGNVFIDENFEHLSAGDIVKVKIDEASEYDLWGRVQN